MRRRQGGWAALAILIILAVSIAAALYYKHEYDAEHDKRTAAETKLHQANEETQRCNDSIAAIEEAARESKVLGEKARMAAEQTAQAHTVRANRQIATPPSVPGDDYRSAAQRFDRWLADRKKP